MAKFSRKHSKMKKPRDMPMIGLSPERVSRKKLMNMAMIKLRQKHSDTKQQRDVTMI